MLAAGWPGSRPRCPVSRSAARLVLGFVTGARHAIVPGRWLAAAHAQAPGRPLLKHPVATASSCDHAGRDGLRHCLIGRLAGLPGHP
jgi:hypothetical protein